MLLSTSCVSVNKSKCDVLAVAAIPCLIGTCKCRLQQTRVCLLLPEGSPCHAATPAALASASLSSSSPFNFSAWSPSASGVFNPFSAVPSPVGAASCSAAAVFPVFPFGASAHTPVSACPPPASAIDATTPLPPFDHGSAGRTPRAAPAVHTSQPRSELPPVVVHVNAVPSLILHSCIFFQFLLLPHSVLHLQSLTTLQLPLPAPVRLQFQNGWACSDTRPRSCETVRARCLLQLRIDVNAMTGERTSATTCCPA